MRKYLLSVFCTIFPFVSSASTIITSGETYNLNSTSQDYDVYGALIVENSGIDNGSVVYNGGREVVYGKSYGTIVNSGADFEVMNGGYASDINLQGGRYFVQDGGTSVKLNLFSGDEYVYGYSESTVLRGGTQNVQSGGVSKAPSLFSGTINVLSGGSIDTPIIVDGLLRVYGGATINNAVINGGTLNLYTNSTFTGCLHMLGGVVNVGKNISFDSVELNGGAINLKNGTSYEDLSINKLVGNGKFYLNSNLSSGQTDKIIINDGDGDYQLVVTDYSAEPVYPDKITVVDGTSYDKFSLVGGKVDVGAFTYKLDQIGTQWDLVRTLDVADSAVIAKDTYATIATIMYSHLQTLHQRIGEVRFDKSEKSALWVRGIGRKLKFDFDDGSKTDVDIYGMQIGADTNISENSIIGVFGNYTNVTQKFDREGKGNGYTNSIGIYNSWEKNGWYTDLVLAYYWHNQKIKTYTPALEQAHGKYNVNAWSTSFEFGKKIDLENNWFVEPHIQVVYMDVGNVKYRNSFNTLIQGKDAQSLLGIAGASVGKEYADWRAFIRLDGVQEFEGNPSVTVAGYEFKEDLSEFSVAVSLGVDTKLSEQQHLYLTLGTSYGDHVKMPIDGTLGYKYEF